MLPFYCKNRKNLKFAHLNVNSLRHKFRPLADLLKRSIIDVISVQETKLDESFPIAQFKLEGFCTHRKDYKSNSGGLIMIVRDDIPQRQVPDLEISGDESGRIESLAVEIVVRKEKWILCSVYKQPKVSNDTIVAKMSSLIDKCLTSYKNCIIFGDLNVNMTSHNCLSNILDVHGVKNLVNGPTCFKSVTPTSIDVVLTNVPKRIQNTVSIDVELSDFHHMVCWATKMSVPPKPERIVKYRSYKKFEESEYTKDLSAAPFHVSEVFDDVDDCYWFCEKLITDLINIHAPLKSRKVKSNDVPYMNDELRKATNVKNMFKRKFDKCKSTENWNRYRMHRNIVNSLRKKCLKQHVEEKCKRHNIDNGRDFWQTVKPLISDKGNNGSDRISLIENNVIVNNSKEVGDIFNVFYKNVTKHIGEDDTIDVDESIQDIIKCHESHKSVKFIKTKAVNGNFSFNIVKRDDVSKKLKNLNSKKATGYDSIPPKLLKIGADVLTGPVTYLVNRSIESCKFPSQLKCAEVTPIFKKENMLEKKNYRPVSVLPAMSKIFEGVLIDQLSNYFNDKNLLSPYLSGFRKGHSCQSVLLRYVEDCKQVLDKNDVCGSILMDLSKAFDCLPHKLLIAKLNAYGINQYACTLVASYFQGRKQRVKIGNEKSDWIELVKGAPQGSLMGPFAYNIDTNDLLMLVQGMCNIYNYADDNTISCSGSDVSQVVCQLQCITNIMLDWFTINFMQANPDKFQFIMYGATNSISSITLGKVDIKKEKCVKLLGVCIDSQLNFNEHIDNICKKAGKKLNALIRLSNTIDIDAKRKLFDAFIVSSFNFCPVVWHFVSYENMKKIENVQKRALRFICNDFTSPYSVLRINAGKSLLYVQRLRCIALEVFKIYHNECPTYLYSLIQKRQIMYDTRTSCPVSIPSFNTVRYGRNSFKYQAAYLWNTLDDDLKNAVDVKSFKRLLNEWNGPSCHCSCCKLCILKTM